MDYFCILAGGGVRGTAYIGVLDFFDEVNINIKGMAGSSVGAVFSALHSVGYNHQELEKLLLALNYEQFRDLYLPFGKEFGLCKGDNFLKWIKKTLELKIYGNDYTEGGNPPICFKDLDKDLFIIATDVCSSSAKEFSRYSTPDVEIAQAVRASISIPGFFKPVYDESACLVDGDIIKNLPIWTFSKNIVENHENILEIRLESCSDIKTINNPFEYFNAVIDTASNISTDFVINLYGRNDKFDFIKINTENIGLIDFSINDEQKRWLIERGYNTVKESFCGDLTAKKMLLKDIYGKLLKSLIEFKKLLKKQNIKECKIEFAQAILISAQHFEMIDKSIYDNLININELFSQNIKKSIFLHQEGLKSPKTVEKKLEETIKLIEKKIYEIEYFIQQITNIDVPKIN
jgi:hypothetical protein